jgi:TRAP-type C4-dicarboxylate transport system substrate-binding protein
MQMTRRRLLAAAGTGSLCLAAPAIPAQAQESIDLSIGASFPTAVAWVQPGQAYFMPEVNRRLQAAGDRFRINWKEAWGGTLFKANATLTSVADGVVDIGYVWSILEASKMPLSQVSLSTPFSTSDCAIIGAAIHETVEKVPQMTAEWERNGLTFLGASTVDTYHVYTKTPVTSLDDLRGRKLSAAGAIGLWVRDAGAVNVQSTVATFYTDVQSGVSDGVVAPMSGAASSKLFEVAPNIALVDFGGINNGGLAMTKRRFDNLPEPVRAALRAVGRDFSMECGRNVVRRAAADFEAIKTQAKAQNVALNIVDLSGAPRARYAAAMSDLAREWQVAATARGLPAQDVLTTYLAALRARGATPVRNWAS